jgi:two-component system, NtrC family, response regulator GlrR
MARRILLVDDNPLVLTTLGLMLESSGYLVTTAESGIRALAEMSEPYDAAVMDYELPDLNGDALAQLLCNIQPRLPIILFSGCPELPNNASHEFAAVVLKGSPMADLLDTIADLIQENAKQVPSYDEL